MTHTIRLTLFDYQGTYQVHRALTTFWACQVPNQEFLAEVHRAREYGRAMVKDGEARNYHVIAGED